MKKYILLLIAITVIQVSYAQSKWINDNEDYFFIGTAIDPRNTFFTGEKDTQGYNGIIKAGYKDDWAKIEMFYEIYPNIDYESFGLNLYFLHDTGKRLVPGAGLQLSIIERPTKVLPSFAGNLVLEYHINRFYLSARAEGKYRSDLKPGVYYYGGEERVPIKFSGYLGLGFKF